ncbi:xanthine dehydrogenase family protein molybdopterin-binding subunit [Thalassobaculum sp.]|uniref:xanthine dehydrogenase family protein molybdopterin-binding subunit n=1 Tax=Thalassobaculum sp. TaxID=2022740 RepID=UPI0032EC92B8
MSDQAPEMINMGLPAPRVDGRLKVTGEARYPADVPIANLAHSVLVTSTIACGRIAKIHDHEAWAVPGVIEVLSYTSINGQLGKPRFGVSSTSIGPLHEPRIWHDGQIVALVVADAPEAAEEAARLIAVDYVGTVAPSAGFDSDGAETVDASEVAGREDPAVGDFDHAYAKAPITIDSSYSTPTQHHNPLELFSTTAVWEDGRLTVYEPSQNVHGWRNALAAELKMDPARVRIVSRFIGGAFGSKGPMTPRTAIVALAARRIGRPVRCVVRRDQGYTTATFRAETRHRIRLGADADGRITAYGHDGWEVTSRPDDYLVAGTDTTAKLYGFGSVATKVHLVRSDRNTPGYMRSPPETPYMFALESAMDEMAEALGMDPIEFRRINDTMKEPINGAAYTSRSLMRCYEEAAEAFGWSDRDPEVGSMRDGDWIVGYGCATAMYPSNIGAATARVCLHPNGHATVQTASHEIGTGIRTVSAQLAAECLGIPVDAVDVETGDSTLPPAPVSGGSNSTASVCSAILKACNSVRARLFRAVVAADGGPFSGFEPSTLEIKEGKILGPGPVVMDLGDALARTNEGVLEEYAEFVPEGMNADSIRKLYAGQTPMHGGMSGPRIKCAFGAEFVEVRVHRRTREVRVPRMVGAFAGGRIMNPRTARSQLMGGMIWGLGCALHEATEIDRHTARYLNRDLQDYLVPVNADVDQVEVILVPEHDSDVNPVGVKGLGELGNVGTPAAIANAIYHATGRRVRDLPIRVESLLS